MSWHEFGVAAALLLVVEGIVPFLSPQGLRRMLENMMTLSDGQLRVGGLTSMVAGVVLLYVLRVGSVS